jgi:hypothetical protein
MSKRTIAAVASTLAVFVSMIALSLTPATAAPAVTIRGVIGLDTEGVAGLTDGGDWGAVASIGGRGATTRLSDIDVAVDSVLPTGVTNVSVGDSGDHGCNGTWLNPTAPPDKVCIYIANADNAVDIRGVSISPGSAGTWYGFKIVWSHSVINEDSFVDAVWAYRRPAT